MAKRTVIVQIFGRDTPVELDAGDDGGNAGDREPRHPIDPAGTSHAEAGAVDEAP